MKRVWIIMMVILMLAVVLSACDSDPVQSPEVTTEETTEEITTDTEQSPTEEPTTEEITTEEITTEEITTEEITTEEVTLTPVDRDAVREAAVLYLDAAAMMEAADNEQQDWSDFGGLTENEDGSVTALFRMGSNDIWDPYFYLLKKDSTVGDILVIQYRCTYDFPVKLFMGTEGNFATGSGDEVLADIYGTEGDWNYLILDMKEDAFAYDADAAALGYLRFGLDMAESGDTVDFGFVAFFNTMAEVEALIPQ